MFVNMDPLTVSSSSLSSHSSNIFDQLDPKRGLFDSCLATALRELELAIDIF